MTADDKQARSEYATPDLACTRCRERKIRCGRERPSCSNCERDGDVQCVYQNPTKRVNHIKLLCDSFELLQGRLASMESNITRIAAASGRCSDSHKSSSTSPLDPRTRPDEELNDETGEDDDQSDFDDAGDFHIFRNKVDMADRYHGPSSLFALCGKYRTRLLGVYKESDCDNHMHSLLHNLCEAAGALEPFPFHSDPLLGQLIPKQQAVIAIGHFLQHLDVRTDIFSEASLLANLERIYSQRPEPGDDAWAICFRAIALLVLGMELSAQAKTALFGDFARSFLPNRAALVNSSLLSTPRLINVQALILLSVAMKQFDPPGWADVIFTHACMLARTMGIHHVRLSLAEASAEEKLERAKVLRSLYVQDKSLCITSGTVSWLPTHDCKLTSQLRAAVERQAPFSDRIRLSMIQDDVYKLTHATRRRKSGPSNKSQNQVMFVEQKLSDYANAVGLFDQEPPYSAHRTLIILEFLATRIIALQHGLGLDYAAQVRRDAKASCLLLLIAHGETDPESVQAFQSLMAPSTSPVKKISTAAVNNDTIPFGSLFDSFSVPAFFVLLEECLHATKEPGAPSAAADLDHRALLQKVSDCYNLRTGHLQSNNYHRKVSRIFEQLLNLMKLHDKTKQNPLEATAPVVPVAEMLPLHLMSTMPPYQADLNAFSNCTMPPVQGQLSAFLPTPSPSTSMSWDNWLTMPSGPGLTASLDGSNSGNLQGPDTDLLAEMLGTSHPQPSRWSVSGSDSTSLRKRRRTHEESAEDLDGEVPSPLSDFLISGQEIPFHLIS